MAAGLLVAFVVWRWRGYTQSVDLHAYDEFHYLNAGLRLWRLEALPELAWAPAYSAVLALLHLALPDGAWCFDLMNFLVRLGVAVACWWAFRPVLPSVACWLLGVWLTLLDCLTLDVGAGVMAGGNVYGFGLACLVVALGCWLRRRVLFAVLACSVLVCVRGEYGVFVLALFIFGWLLRVDGRLRFVVGALAALALLAMATLAPSAKARSWLAFEQHYARFAMHQRLLDRYVSIDRMTRSEIMDALAAINGAFDEPWPVISEDYPGARTLGDAVRIAPQRVMAFAIANAKAAPAGVIGAVSPAALGRASVLFALAGLALIGAARHGICAWRGSRRARRVLAGLLACCVTVLPSFFLTGLRTELALPLGLAVMLCAACGLSACLERLLGPSHVYGAWIGVAVALLIAVAQGLPKPYASAGQESMPVRDTLAALQEFRQDLTSSKFLVAKNCAFAFKRLCWQQGANFVDSGPFSAAGPEDAARLLAERGVNLVVWDRWLAFELRNAPAMLAELQGANWRRQARSGSSDVFVRVGQPASAPSAQVLEAGFRK